MADSLGAVAGTDSAARRSPPVPRTRLATSTAVEAPGAERSLDVISTIVVLCVAFLVRFGRIGPASLWLDDAWVALASRVDDLGTVIDMGTSFPGFVVVQRLVIRLVGIDATWGAQLLPLAAGTLAPAVVYLIARGRGIGRAAALVGAAALVVAPFHVEYSARAKPFTVDALASVALVGLAWWLAEDDLPARQRRRLWAVWTAVAVIAIVLSASVGLVVAGCGLVMCLAQLRRDGLRGLIEPGAAAIGIAAVAGPWMLFAVTPNLTETQRNEFSDHLLVLSGGPVTATTRLVSGLATIVATFATIDALVAAALLVAVPALLWWRPFAAAVLGSGLATTALLSVGGLVPFGVGRTEILHHPALALLLAAGAHEIATRLPDPARLVLPLGACVLLATAGLGTADYPDEDIRPLLVELRDRRNTDEPIIVTPDANYAFSLYDHRRPVIVRDERRSIGFDVRHDDAYVVALPEVGPDRSGWAPVLAAQVGASPDHLWVVATHNVDTDVAEIVDLLAPGYVLDWSTGDEGAALHRFRPR